MCPLQVTLSRLTVRQIHENQEISNLVTFKDVVINGRWTHFRAIMFWFGYCMTGRLFVIDLMVVSLAVIYDCVSCLMLDCLVDLSTAYEIPQQSPTRSLVPCHSVVMITYLVQRYMALNVTGSVHINSKEIFVK